MSRLALLCSWERQAVTCYGLFCFALAYFVWLLRGENCHMLRFALRCFASLRFALLCFAFHCIVHLWNEKKASHKHAERMPKAS